MRDKNSDACTHAQCSVSIRISPNNVQYVYDDEMALEVAIAPLIKSLSSKSHSSPRVLSGEVRQSHEKCCVLLKSHPSALDKILSGDLVLFDRSTFSHTQTHILFLVASDRRSSHAQRSKQRNGSLITVTLNLRKATVDTRAINACYRDNTCARRKRRKTSCSFNIFPSRSISQCALLAERCAFSANYS